ncbi:MAG: hypothetical protein KU37_03485 [Sulfuricurvum sp. PC08-66]|nr:MAG: hypothetical protein KU37_03485 [Sulfuricurvum sp. PC08-66]
MDAMVIGVIAFVVLIVIVIFYLLIFKTNHEVIEQVELKTVRTLNDILRDPSSSAQTIQEAFDGLVNSGRFIQETPTSMRSFELFLMHPNCNARMFARTTLDLIKRYPHLQSDFERLNHVVIKLKSAK